MSKLPKLVDVLKSAPRLVSRLPLMFGVALTAGTIMLGTIMWLSSATWAAYAVWSLALAGILLLACRQLDQPGAERPVGLKFLRECASYRAWL